MAMVSALAAARVGLPLILANERYCRGPEQLIVSEHLQDRTYNVDEDVLLECRIDGPRGAAHVWYRNGNVIENKGRFHISTFKNWYRLEIKRIRTSDQGAYCIICTNDASQAFTAAKIFVPTLGANEVAYFTVNPYDCTRIMRHLSSAVVNVGEKIELDLHMETYVHIKYFWFKNDVPIFPSQRVFIKNNNSSANLIINEASFEDAGIYVVVMWSREGLLSSYANVHVLPDIDINKIALPAVVEHLKRDLDVLENQYVKMLCHGVFDNDTKIEWYMNDVLLDDCHILQHDYGNGYVALKILDTYVNVSAKYRLILRHGKTGRIDISTCNLTVHKSSLKPPMGTDVVKPLESVVAACGASVLLHCTFSSKNHLNLRAIWFVGRYKVERSNSLFSVICKGGTFMLYIKKMSVEMAGEILCEIHQWEQSPKFVHVSQTMANLTMVPAGVLTEGTGDKETLLFTRGTHFKAMDVEEGSSSSPAPSELIPRKIFRTIPVKFKFCKLDDDGRYYLYIREIPGVKVFYNPPDMMPHQKRKIGVFQWSGIGPLGAWFSLAIQVEDGSYREIGVTSVPKLEVEEPPLETMVIFHVSTVLPVRAVHRPLLCFRNNSELEMKITPQRRVRKYNKFEDWYTKKEELIGAGAFGKVSLVEDDFGDSFAAKTIRVHERNKIDYALREFFMLRKLSNNNVVGVVDAYEHSEFVVLIMDYMWGGELFERIIRDKHINEADISLVVKQICNGLAYIHKQNVVHLDLKPENIVFAHPNSLVVKLVDFGLSRVLHEDSKIRAVHGTREYVAPEILNFEPIELNSDMWSLGVVVFMMLSGSMPFVAYSEEEQTVKIITGMYNFDEPAFRTISEMSKDFIESLLVVQPRRRFTAEDALKHSWIVEGPPKGTTIGSMKIARAKLKVYMRIYKAKWQVRQKTLHRVTRGFRTNGGDKSPIR